MAENRGNLSGFDFLQIVEDSRKLPETPTGSAQGAVELPPAALQEEDKNPFLEKEVPEDKVAVPTHYLSFSRVFVLWKNWEDCGKCLSQVAAEQAAYEARKVEAEKKGERFTEELDDSERTCHHNHRQEYKETLDRCLRGDGVIVLREAFNLKNGTLCMHLEWGEADPEYVKRQKEIEEAKKANQVYPPDVEGAFRKGKKEAPK